MKITSEPVFQAFAFIIIGQPFMFSIAEYFLHGCNFWGGHGCTLGVVRAICASIIIGVCLLNLRSLINFEIQFEYDVEFPESKRKRLNRLYTQMGEAVMKDDEAEENRIWETIQRIENPNGV